MKVKSEHLEDGSVKFDHIKSQIKQYIDESHTNGELFGKVMDLYIGDDSIPIEIREKTQKLIWSRPVCRQCEFYDFNEMSDEGYCVAKDYEPIYLYRKHRPDWCPRLNK